MQVPRGTRVAISQATARSQPHFNPESIAFMVMAPKNVVPFISRSMGDLRVTQQQRSLAASYCWGFTYSILCVS